jgi:hypothetical protein
MYFYRTQIYEVDDNSPEIPYDIGTLKVFDTKFTPQILLLFAMEKDKGEGPANFNEFLGFLKIKVNPPRGNYPVGSPWEMDPVIWETVYFKAVVKIYFGQK